jgi:hypothetical protein
MNVVSLNGRPELCVGSHRPNDSVYLVTGITLPRETAIALDQDLRKERIPEILKSLRSDRALVADFLLVLVIDRNLVGGRHPHNVLVRCKIAIFAEIILHPQNCSLLSFGEWHLSSPYP